jgi:hypothetical protein
VTNTLVAPAQVAQALTLASWPRAGTGAGPGHLGHARVVAGAGAWARGAPLRPWLDWGQQARWSHCRCGRPMLLQCGLPRAAASPSHPTSLCGSGCLRASSSSSGCCMGILFLIDDGCLCVQLFLELDPLSFSSVSSHSSSPSSFS